MATEPEVSTTVEQADQRDRRDWANFRKLLFGQSVSQLGIQTTAVVLPLVAVLQLRANPLEVGLITSAEFIAYAVLGLVAGVFVDRWRRRRVMLVTDAGRALVIGLVPVLWAAGLLQVWHLFLAALLVGIQSLFFDTAQQAYVPAVISREKLIQGNSQLQASTSVTQLAGPGVGGLLVQAVGGALALLANAATYLVSFGSVLWMRAPQEMHASPAKGAGAPRETIRRQIADGFRYVRRDRILFSVLGYTGQLNFLMTAQQALLVIFLANEVHAPPSLIGFLMASSGVGAIIGAVSSRRLAHRLGSARAWAIGALLGPVLGLLVPFAHLDVTLLCFVIGMAAIGATITIVKVTGQSYRMAIVPANLMGRVVATTRTLTWGPVPIGGALGGLLGQLLGVRPALFVVALLLLTSPLWLLLTPVLRLRNLEDDHPT
jgi:MFS family permease